MDAPVLRLIHVALPAPDIAASAAFYQLLGAKPGFIRKDTEGNVILMQLHFGDAFIELQADAALPGEGHVAFTTGEIDVVWQRLADHGHQPLDHPRRGETPVMWFFVSDPAGNMVEITMPDAAR